MRAPSTGFERVYRREFPFVWAAARRMGVRPAVLDDVVQDVFVTAYRRWGDLRPGVSPRAWLYGVTRRVAFRYRRSEARTVRRKAAVARAGEGRALAPHRDRDEAHDVDAVLAALEPTRRQVFVMAELLDMSGPEIAAELGIPLNTVYSRLRLARRELEPRLRADVEAWASDVRSRDRPPQGQAQRSWAALVLVMGPVSTPGRVLGTWTLGRLLGVVVAAGVVAAAAVAGRPAGGEGEREVPQVREVEAVASGASVRATRIEPPPVEPAAEIDAVAEAAAPAPTDAGSPEPRGRAAHPMPRAARTVPEPTVSATAPYEPEHEVAMLDRAAAALRDGRAAHALQWLDEHELRFPSGRLVDVRKAIRVRALCRLGRDAQARAESAALRREHPGSAVAQRAPTECDEA